VVLISFSVIYPQESATILKPEPTPRALTLSFRSDRGARSQEVHEEAESCVRVRGLNQ